MEEGDILLSQSRAFYAPLLRAALADDWKAAKAFIQNHPYSIRAKITKEEGTALHNAAAAKRTHFVKKLVRLMEPKELELRTNGDCTTLYFAAQSEIVTIAKVMVKKNNNLPSIYPKNCIQVSPLYAAIRTGNREMVSYLYSVTPIEDLASVDLIELLIATISTDLYDTALKILDTLTLAPDQEKDLLWYPLEMLARKPSEIGSKIRPSVWERCLNFCVMKGNLASYHAKGRNNMLHLAGELPSSDRLNIVSGAALQMKRELLWFQEIENIVPKSYVNEPNEKGETPRDIFVKTHEELQKNGEKWMKDTANSCMLVAALIATVVFPAAFALPGGNNQETGIPIFLEDSYFVVFFISDAIAMSFSSTSILVFLSILTSRYTERDFLNSLPRRLALGLATLLISIVGMLIAFTSACFLVFKHKSSVPIRIIVVAPIVPISFFVILHYGLWLDIFHSAFYSNRFLFRSHNRLFKQAIQLGKE
ncbi:hypothetical protein F2P56_033819 [Juglans regia]|uniref:PGG domain-containing protein n=2 Tax=Juglans regia TaxID=51240 RepID=A0A833T8Q1_JUGRE|nr:uncharacterized protein LOC108994599 isoform X2 [Juglans regia]KAF5444710.1 hypothetical protein F2P56_033819 [Juglans regia]